MIANQFQAGYCIYICTTHLYRRAYKTDPEGWRREEGQGKHWLHLINVWLVITASDPDSSRDKIKSALEQVAIFHLDKSRKKT